MPFLALALLLASILLVRAFGVERADYRRFDLAEREPQRLDFYRRWLRDLVLVYGGLSLVGLLALFVPQLLRGNWGGLPTLPTLVAAWPELDAMLVDAQARGPFPWLRGEHGPLGPILIAAVGGLMLLVLFAVLIPVALGRVDADAVYAAEAMIPRTRTETRYGAAMSVGAGVLEEALFRLALPGLLYAALGDAWLAFLLAGVVFALVHVYQGWVGTLAAGSIGIIFAGLYAVTGSILLVMLIHAVIDVRSLVLTPMLLRRSASRRPAAIRSIAQQDR
ncbi:CPBP family intramembrane glutamic endopeptidase [Microbacterium sp.]|uniref:CPBP family intramembrane glutamic endopeptidase n=1 Tax=Microbacterium sp. TaxID=51671 RepID=UPI003C77AE6C